VLTDEGLRRHRRRAVSAFCRYLDANSEEPLLAPRQRRRRRLPHRKIPFLRGDDRETVIARKLGQHFFSATLTASLSLGYEKSRRKDERILLAALTNNEFFAPWLAALASCRGGARRRLLAALAGPSLLRKLGVADERCLLLTIQDQSIRQSYLEKGELHFSRLTRCRTAALAASRRPSPPRRASCSSISSVSA
jgi:hypothetical protein